MKITSPGDLLEIYQILVRDPDKARMLVGMFIKHSEYGDGTIILYAPINGLVVGQFENFGKRDIGPTSWKDGRIRSIWMEEEELEAIRAYNKSVEMKVQSNQGEKVKPQPYQPVQRLSSIEQAVSYLEDLLSRIKRDAINDELLQAIFAKFPDLEDHLPDEVITGLINSPTWAVVPTSLQGKILLRSLLLSPQNEEAERFQRLSVFLQSDLSINSAIWNLVPDRYLEDETLWPVIPEPAQLRMLSQKIVHGQALVEQMETFISLQQKYPATDYLSKIPQSLLFQPVLFSALAPEKKARCLLELFGADSNADQKAEVLGRMADMLKIPGQWQFFAQAPDTVLLEPEIWPLCPVEKKVPILVGIIISMPPEENSRRGKIAELADLMMRPQTYSLWRTIPPSLYEESEIYVIVPPNLKVPFLLKAIQNTDAKDQREQKIQELAGVLESANDISLWRMLYNYEDLILEPPLIKIALLEVKQRLFEPAARKLTNLSIAASFDSISLDDDDLCLAARWLKPPLAEKKRTAGEIRKLLNYRYIAEDWSRVLSARVAEKAVYQFLTRLGRKTEDISIKQETNQEDKRWENYDLLTDKDAIDVKNSRAAEFDHKRYVEYRVPKFKKDPSRQGNLDVVIAGVFSPNLLPKEIVDPTPYGPSGNPVVQVLGMTNFQYIAGLREDFHRDGRFELSFRREDYGSESFLPPWMFDYPEAAYPSRTWAVERINRIQSPIDQLAQAGHFPPLPFILLLEKPPYDGPHLANWQKSLVKTFGSVPLSRRLSLPRIFLAVLTHFVNMATSKGLVADGYEPKKVKEMLYVNQNDRQYPLFVFDPLETVSTLLDNLQMIWGNKHGFIGKFKSFKLIKLGIIKGISKEDEKWKTILAYCGTPGCHYSPLIYGIHDPCVSGRLICPKCHTCGEETCKHCRERKRQEDALKGVGDVDCPEEPEMEDWVDSMPEYQEDSPEDNFWA